MLYFKHLQPLERRRRDSNPRYLSVRQFSRLLQSTALPLLRRADLLHLFGEASAKIDAFVKKGNLRLKNIFSNQFLSIMVPSTRGVVV